MKKISLNELHENLLRSSFKDDNYYDSLSVDQRNSYLRKHFVSGDYYIDNWYSGKVPLAKLLSSNETFDRSLRFDKDKTYVSQWKSIKEQLEQHWLLIPREVFERGQYPPIILREYQKGFYNVWDGQRRTLSAFWHDLDEINAYIYSS